MDSGTGQISELLKHYDDLEKVSNIKQKLTREKAAIDGQLKAGVKSQIEVILKGVTSLSEAKLRADQVRDDMVRINKLRKDSRESVQNFEKINQVARALQNFEETQRFIDNFRTMQNELADIQRLMEEDGPFQIEHSTMPNLLAVHHGLSKLRDVKDDALFYAALSTEDVRRTIAKHFAALDKLVEEFDATIFVIAGCLLEVAGSGDRSLIVRVAKIIDHEEKLDMVYDITKEIMKDQQPAARDLLQSTNRFHRIPRHYPTRYFQAIEASVKQTFENCIDHFSDQDGNYNILQVLDSLKFIFTDLEMAKTALTRLMPERWKIFDKYVEYYHKATYELLNGMMANDPTAADILHILEYVKNYYAGMQETLGVSQEQLVPKLLDGKEDSLYDEYLALLVSKLREWYTTFARTEKENFVLRQVPPDTLEGGFLGMDGEQTMFKLITQQIDVAINSGQGRILAGCIEECASILKQRQGDWDRLMKKQVQLQLEDTATDEASSSVPGGLVEYLIALANDQIRAADYTEAISSQKSQLVSKKYQNKIVTLLDDVCDGYILLSKSCIHGLINIIFNDLTSPYNEIFESSAWYKGRPTRQIVDTILEYAIDCQQHMNPILLEVFMEELLHETVAHYLTALGNGTSLIKVPKGTDRIKLDIELFYGLFTENNFGLEDQVVQDSFRIFEHLLSVLESPMSDMLARFQELRADFWDAPLDMFEKMMMIRKDYDSRIVKGIMHQVRNEALQTHPTEQKQPTYLARYQPKKR